MLLSLYTPVHVWAGCPWFSAGSLSRNTECVQGPEAQTAASSPRAPEIQISQSGIPSRAVLTALFFILHFDFPWLLPRQRLSRTPSQPIPSCPIPWFFILAFPFLFSRSDLGSFYPFSSPLAFVACWRARFCVWRVPTKSLLAGTASPQCSQHWLGWCFFNINFCLPPGCWTAMKRAMN